MYSLRRNEYQRSKGATFYVQGDKQIDEPHDKWHKRNDDLRTRLYPESFQLVKRN